MSPVSRRRVYVTALVAVGTGAALYATRAPREASVGAPVAQTLATVATPAVAEEKPVARSPGCRFQVGAELSYAITAAIEARVDRKTLNVPAGVDVPASLSKQAHSTLDLRALSVDDTTGAVLLARYRDVDASLTRELGDVTTPFLVRVATDCKLTGFARLQTAGLPEARGEQAMTYNLLWARPMGGNETAVSEGSSDYGQFRASYKEVPGPRPRVQRTIQAYTRVWAEEWESNAFERDDGKGGGGARRKEQTPLASTMTVDVGAGPWFASIDGTERVSIGGTELESHVMAREIATPQGALAGLPTAESSYVWEDLLHRKVRAKHAEPRTKGELAEIAAVKNLTLDAAMGQYMAHVQKQENISQTWPHLEKYLEARPAAATELAKQIKDGKLPEEGSAGVFVALGKTPTTEARDALLSLKNDGSVAMMDRARSAFALVDREDVGVELAQSLRTDSQAIVTGPTREVRIYARHAALALGMMANLRASDTPAIAAEARSAVNEIFAKGRTAKALSPGFGTVANLGDPSLLSTIEPYTVHPDMEVRRAATISIRRMPPSSTTAMALTWLRRETAPEVKRDLYHVLRLQHLDARVVPDRAFIAQAITDLSARPGALTRQSIVHILGSVKDVYPEAKAALMAVLPLELAVPDEGIYEQASSYLSPDEIAAALPANANADADAKEKR
ncbi:MAG: hypothetical protein QOI41_7479 [Myxococcales bacterium]|nr:hypothetical protein [Myxococcales bacterium]